MKALVSSILTIIFLLPLRSWGECDCKNETALLKGPTVAFVGVTVGARSKHPGWTYPGFLFQILDRKKVPAAIPVAT
jgi:hypothetical protein